MAKLSVNKALLRAGYHAKKGEIEEAQKLYQAVLQTFPNNKRAQQGLADLNKHKQPNLTQSPPPDTINQLINLYDQGQLAVVVEHANKLAVKYPNSFAIWNILGAAAAQTKQMDKAISALLRVIAIQPHYAEAYNNMGNVLRDQGKLEKAMAYYQKALSLKSDYPEARYNVGVILQDQNKFEEAIASYQKALSLKPDYLEAYNNLGNVLKDQGKLDEAIASYKEALSLKPDSADAYNNMGNALHDQGKLDEAIACYHKALSLEPDDPEVHDNMGFALLAAKYFDRGFKHCEWRWQKEDRANQFLKSTKPPWNGEKGQRVLVWNEQGIGDEIMFSSIVPEIYAASSKILVKCDRRLIPLFERSFPTDVTYYSGDSHVSEDEYDFHIPMGSLPLTFRKSLESFKTSASGFLKCDTARAESIKGQLTQEQSKKLIGISWNTKSPTRNSSDRNINLADLARALDSSNTQLVSLQYGDVSDEIEAVKKEFGIDVIQFDAVDNKNDIDGLASLILACDQIVSTTNVTVHLAGALGVKVTVLLPFSPRWIWGDGSKSFWYESVTPIKQNCHHNWNNVLDNLRSNSSGIV